MSETKRSTWATRSTFILASIGSAVGLGNAWRFPGLAAKHGGGTFLLVYLVAMCVMGIPLLMMEVSIARKFHKGAGESIRGLNRKMEFVGWSATANAFVIVTYYAVVFAWVLLMVVGALKFAGMTGDSEAASNVFATLTQTTWNVPAAISDWKIPIPVLIALLIAWLLMYYCIRDGAQSVGKVVKYTVFLPVILLLIMAVKGCTMPGASEGLARFFIPQIETFSDPTLWIDAIGQVFYSLSICMAIMFAYGSYLQEDSNIAVDCTIIAVGDAAISILSGIVMFSTMGGVGMLDNMSASGIATAFIIYPQAIVNLTSVGWFNALFGVIFYLMLVTLAIDSAFSIVEGVSTALADKFHVNHKKITRGVCMVAAVISLLYATRAGLAWLDIVDNWTNQVNLILIGVLECITVGWCFNTEKTVKKINSNMTQFGLPRALIFLVDCIAVVLCFNTDKIVEEINRNTTRFRMPRIWFHLSIKFVSPYLLIRLFRWNMIELFKYKGGVYGYTVWAEFLAGWLVSILVFTSGIWIRLIIKAKEKKGFKETEITWEE